MKIKLYLLFFSACFSMHAFAVIHTITVGCCVYTPSTLTANCGDTIRFQWLNLSHPTVSDIAAWTTFPMDAANPTKDIVLTTAGTYPYYCDIHGDPGGVGMSGTITITCTPPPCTTPATITAGMITSSSAKIVWSAVAGATKYNIQYRPVGTPTWLKKNSNSTSKNITGLSASTTYQYRVRAMCGASSASPYTAIQTFTTLPLRLAGTNIEFSIYPNPNNGTFTINLAGILGLTSLEIYDVSNRMIYNEKILLDENNQIQKIQLDNYKGICLMKIICGETQLAKMIIVE